MRHIIVDTLRLLLVVVVSAASADDGTFSPEVLRRLTPEQSGRLELIWADGKYNNRRLDRWLAKAKVGYRIEVIGRPPESVGWVREAAEALGGRTDIRLDRPLSEEQPGLRVAHEHERVGDPDQLDSSHAQKVESR